MKYLFTLLAALFLTACNTVSTSDENTSNTISTIDARNAGSQKIDPKNLARLGDTCGPNSQKICDSGLTCQFEGLQQDAGKCLPTVVNADLECDTTQAPVCGVLGNNKNGYLNECFARRYGAVVVNEGFCKPDQAIKNDCEARAYSLGNCQESFNGAWMNPETKNCENITLVGCGADIPFDNLETCEQTCS